MANPESRPWEGGILREGARSGRDRVRGAQGCQRPRLPGSSRRVKDRRGAGLLVKGPGPIVWEV